MLNYYPTILSAMGSYKLAGEELLGRYMLLCLFCAQSDFDDGVIKDCKKWKRDQWKIAVGVRKAPTNDTKLWHWEGEDLHLNFFGTKYIEGCRARSEKGRSAVNSRKDRQPKQLDLDTQVDTQVDTINKENKVNKIKEKNNLLQGQGANDTESEDIEIRRPPLDEIMSAMKEVASSLSDEQLKVWAEKYYDTKEQDRWMYKDKPLYNWKPNARNWLRACLENQKNTGKSVPASREGLAPGETDRNRNIFK